MDQNEQLTERQYRALIATDRARLSPEQVAWLSPAQVAWLSPAQVARLSPEQVAWLSPAQVARLSPEQVARLSPAQVAWLSPAQVAWLSPEGMKKRQDLWEKVPLVAGLYSRMAADIASEKRMLDQSTFGPDGPPVDVCGTPMCIAGHTVHLAGSAGYELKQLVGGFAAAAAMIHAKSRPDAPRPRYDSYPDECALAYIEERAAEEQAA